jgi:hypothetical protein
MKKNLYDTLPLDDLENELLNEDFQPLSIKNLESEKLRLQNISNLSLEKRKLLTDIMQDKDFDDFIKIVSNNGIDIKDAFHNIFQKVINGSISTKVLSS